MNPGVVDMIAKFVAVNAVATLVLAVMSYALSALILNGLEALDRWLDPSSRMRNAHPHLKYAAKKPPVATDGNGS